MNISKHNKSFDLEAQNEGEYWLVFRGFLQLQRDVAVGKMAAQRAQGFGHVGHRKGEGGLRNRKTGAAAKGKSHAEDDDDDERDKKGKKKVRSERRGRRTRSLGNCDIQRDSSLTPFARHSPRSPNG